MNGHAMRPGDPLVLRHAMDLKVPAENGDDQADSMLLGTLAEAVSSAAAHPDRVKSVRRGDVPISWIHEDAFGRLRIGVVAGAAAAGDRGMMEIDVEHQPSDDGPRLHVVLETYRARNLVDYHRLMGPATLERLSALLSSAANAVEDPIDVKALTPAVHTACIRTLHAVPTTDGRPVAESDFILIDATPFTPSTLRCRGSDADVGVPDLPPMAMLHRPERGPMRLSPLIHVAQEIVPPDAMEIMRSTALLLDLYGKDPSWGA